MYYEFYVKTYLSSPPANPFIYSSIMTNHGSGFDSHSMVRFTTPQRGYYWLFATVVWDGKTPAEFTLLSSDLSAPLPQILRNHTYYNNYDTNSRDFIRHLNTGQVITSSSLYNTFADSTIGTSWGGFMLDNILPQLVSIYH